MLDFIALQAGKRLSLDSGYAEGEEQLEADKEDDEEQVIQIFPLFSKIQIFPPFLK